MYTTRCQGCNKTVGTTPYEWATADICEACAKQQQEEHDRMSIKMQYDKPRPGAPQSVLQDWVCEISFMQQSVLITAVRGPDGIRKDHPVKVLIRYLRRSFMICAFDGVVRLSPYEPGGGSFTGPLHLNAETANKDAPNVGHLDGYVGTYLRHVDELPHHFQLHLMHAAEILGYKHPDGDVREFWRQFYFAIVKDAHLRPETEEMLDRRLGDREDTWREGEVVVAETPGERRVEHESGLRGPDSFTQRIADNIRGGNR